VILALDVNYPHIILTRRLHVLNIWC